MKSSNQACNKEISIKHFSFKPDNYLIFYQSQWQIGNSANLLYVIYRVLLALTFSITLVISVIDLNDINKSANLRAKWMVYLTNWHFSVATLQSVISAYMIMSMYLHVRKNGEYSQLGGVNRILCSVYWALYTIAVNGALFVSLIYWTMVYDEKVDPLSVVNIFTHAVNAVLLLIDCFIVAHSFQFLHFYMPLAFNIVYVAFTIIYYALGGTNKHNEHYIYSILDWQKPVNTMKNISFVCICGIILHILICFYVRLRMRLAKFLSIQDNTHITFPVSHLLEPLKEESSDSERSNLKYSEV